MSALPCPVEESAFAQGTRAHAGDPARQGKYSGGRDAAKWRRDDIGDVLVSVFCRVVTLGSAGWVIVRRTGWWWDTQPAAAKMILLINRTAR